MVRARGVAGDRAFPARHRVAPTSSWTTARATIRYPRSPRPEPLSWSCRRRTRRLPDPLPTRPRRLPREAVRAARTALAHAPPRQAAARRNARRRRPRPRVQYGTFRFDMIERVVTRSDGESSKLTDTEFRLARLLIDNPVVLDRIVSGWRSSSANMSNTAGPSTCSSASFAKRYDNPRAHPSGSRMSGAPDTSSSPELTAIPGPPCPGASTATGDLSARAACASGRSGLPRTGPAPRPGSSRRLPSCGTGYRRRSIGRS